MADPRLSQNFTNQDAVRLGTVDFEVAALGTAAIASGALVTAGWERLGTMEPGSFKPSIDIEQFDMERGFPKAPVKQFKIGQKGSIAFNLDEYTARAVEVLNGGNDMVRTTASATTVAATPAPTTTVFTLTSATGYLAGDWLVHTDANGKKWDRKIKSISGAAVTLYDPLPAAPASGDAIAKVTLWQVGGGGSKIAQLTGRMIFVDTYDDTVCVHFPKIQFGGKWAPEFKQDANSMLPMEATVIATQQTIGSVTDFLLYQHYIIPKVNS